MPDSQGADPFAIALARGALGSLAVRIVGLGLVFGLQVMLARLLGVEEYGLYVYVLAWFEVLLLAGTMGWDTAPLRFVPAYRSTNQTGLCRGYLRAARTVPLLGSVLIAMMLATATWFFRAEIGARSAPVIFAACLILPLNTLLQVIGTVLQGLRRVFESQSPQFLIRPVLMAAAILGWVAFSQRPLGAIDAMLANAGAAFITVLIAFGWLNRCIPADVREASPVYRMGEWFRVAFPMFLIAGCYFIMQRLDVLMIGAMVNTTQAGIYAVVVRLSEFSILGITAVNMITTPMFAQLHANGSRLGLQRVVALGSLAVAALAVPGILTVWVFGGWLLALFGNPFVEGLHALRVVLLGPLVIMCVWPVGFLASMTGYQTQSAAMLAIAVVVNAILNIVLIPEFGIVGASFASAISLAGWHIAMMLLIRVTIGIDPTVLSIRHLRQTQHPAQEE